MTDYRISRQAENDLEAIYRFGAERYGLSAADRFLDAIFACFELIAKSPLMWPRVDDVRQGYRRYLFRSGSGRTAIYYRMMEDSIEIMAVIQRQDLMRRLD